MTQSNLLNQISYSQFLGQFTILNTIKLPTTQLFGTDGIRGKVGEQEVLNPALAAKVGFWTGQILQTLGNELAPIIVVQDSRNSSDSLAIAISEGLAAAGVEVWNLGLCPTPAVAYLTHTTEAMGGVMISASHNAPEDNGIKLFGANGTKLSSLIQAQIEAGIRGQIASYDIKLRTRDLWGKQEYKGNLLGQYVDSMLAPFAHKQPLAGMKIVLDLAWGAAVNIAPKVFKEMGAEVIALHDLADGDRINVNCGSTHLDKLQQAVVEQQADLGFAFDGDADRIMAVDREGKAVNGDYILYLWGKALKEKGELSDDTIVTTIMANLGFENAWKALGGKFTRTAVGDRHVYSKMAELGATLGGEQSGHILAPNYTVSGDGVLTALHIANLVKESDKSLAALLADSFVPYPQILENVRVEDPRTRQNWESCAPLQQEIAEAEKAMGDRGRILVRPSGTEPLIRVMVEAEDLDLARYWTNKLVACVTQHLV